MRSSFLFLITFFLSCRAAEIQWNNCASHVPEPIIDVALPPTLPETLKCGRLEVPLNYDDPEGTKIELGFSIYSPQDSQGLLNFNPGGPGEEVSSYPWRVALNLTGGSWFEGLEVFDILGIDTRGFHSSNALNCTLGDLVIPSNLPDTEAEFASFQSQIATYAQTCVDQSTPAGIVEHVGTKETIQDWDAVRQALGSDKINHLGVSYGTYYGAQYAATFPEHADRFVLDAVFATGLGNADLLRWEYASMERVIRRADTACLANPDCPFHGEGKGAIPKALSDVLSLASSNSNSSGLPSADDVRMFVNVWYLVGAPNLAGLNDALGLALHNGNWSGFDYGTLGPIFTEHLLPQMATYCLDYHIEDNSFEGFMRLRDETKASDKSDV